MEPSGPCGSDRPDTSSTSSETAPPLLPCNIEAKAESNSLANWHVACCRKCMKYKRWALRSGTFGAKLSPFGPSGRPAGAQQALREKPYDESDTDHQQQELFVVVAARLAPDQVFRAGVRPNHYRAGRCVRAGGNPAAVALDPGAMSAPRGRYRMGYAGHCGISQRDQAERRPAAGGPHFAGALPVDLRRNPLGIHHAPRVAAGQPEGSFSRLQDLAAPASR